MDKELEPKGEGNWIAPLPFKKLKPPLPNNRTQAAKRATILAENLRRNLVKDNIYQNPWKGYAESAHPLSKDQRNVGTFLYLVKGLSRSEKYSTCL